MRWAFGGLALLLAVIGAVGMRSASTAPDVILLIDVSRSHGPDPLQIYTRARDWWRARAEGSRRVAAVAFGRGAVVLSPLGNELPEIPASLAGIEPGFVDRSDVAAALRVVESLTTDDRGGVAHLFSDGRWNPGDLAAPSATLRQRRIHLVLEGPLDVAATDLRFGPCEPVDVAADSARILVTLTGSMAGPEDVSIEIDGAATGWPPVTVRPGVLTPCGGDIRVDPRANSISVHLVREAGPDGVPANDTITLPLRRAGRRAACVVGESAATKLVEHALAGVDLDVTRVDSWEGLIDGSPLARFDVVIAADVPVARARDADGVARLSTAVDEAGVGLIVIGGPRAFRGGSYAASALEKTLPLSSAPERAREITVLLDRSGSMEASGRLERAVDAVVLLASSLGPDDRISVVPFANEPLDAIPAEPVGGDAFVSGATPRLRKLVASGGTRLAPALAEVFRSPPKGERDRVLVVLSDAEDESADVDGALDAARSRLATLRVETVFVLLDPKSQTRSRVDRLGARRVDAEAVTPRVLLDAVDREAFVAGRIPTRLSDGGPGPDVPWRNGVRVGRDAQVSLTTADGRPLVAETLRGRGRVAAFAAWPFSADEPEVGQWVARIARPAGRHAPRIRVIEGRLVLVWPDPATAPTDSARFEAGGRTWSLAEVAPGQWRFPPDGRPTTPWGAVESVAMGRVEVPLPYPGDPEYVWPPQARDDAASDPVTGQPRSRIAWLAVSAAAWAVWLLLRSDGRRFRSETRAGR